METKLVRYQKAVCTDSNIIDHYLSEIRNATFSLHGKEYPYCFPISFVWFNNGKV